MCIDIILNEKNLNSSNFNCETNYKKDFVNNMSSNYNHNSISNHFNSVLSNSNFNISQTLTKYSDNSKINPSYEKCKNYFY